MGRTLEQLLADEKPEVVAQAESMATETLLNIHWPNCVRKCKKRRWKWRMHWGYGNLRWREWKNRVAM